jgi:hypothetical protein
MMGECLLCVCARRAGRQPTTHVTAARNAPPSAATGHTANERQRHS